MFLRTVTTIGRFSLLILPLVAVAAAGCGGGDDKGGTAGTTGSAGSGTTGGTTGTGGSTGTAGTSGVKNCTVAVATAADATILEFSSATGAMAPSFGNYMPGTYGGGTFIYPDKNTEADLMGLANEFDGMTWHITGLVKKYAGFGLYLTSVTDASMFGGLQFDIKGTFTATGAGDGGVSAAQATMTVTDVPHEVNSAHTADGRMTCGTCSPVTEYDGTCAVPSKVIPLTAATVTQTVHWSDLTGGRRPPSYTGENPNPAQITAISWSLPWNGDGSPQYTVDITIDNIKYLAP